MLSCRHLSNTCPLVSLSHTPLSHSLFRKCFTLTSGVYKRLGQFDYGQQNCTTDHIKTCIHQDKYSWIYIGEVKEGTDDTPHGIGIKVYRLGDIKEGYWKNGQLHGRGRIIYVDTTYYIGEFKEGNKHGEGIYYHWNGDKYTGQWDGGKGQGEINYNDGKKYTGQWNWYKREGLGTLYSADGQVLNQGKWNRNKYMGQE